MEPNKPHSARKGVILLGVFLFFVISLLVILFFSHFKFYQQISIDNKIVGYYKTKEEFNTRYAQIAIKSTTKEGYEAVSYLAQTPVISKKLVTIQEANRINNMDLLPTMLKTDYTIYILQVNQKEAMYCKTQEKALEKQKQIIKDTKEGTDVQIITKVINDIQTINVPEENDKIIDDTIKIYRKPVTSRSGQIRNRTAISSLIWPVNSKLITSPFGQRHGRLHKGVDIGIPSNSVVKSAKAGTVIQANWCGGYGNYIKIDHGNGLVTAYAHNNKLLVSKGQQVNAGQQIAYSGSTGNSTGPHLHFEVIINGQFKNPLNYF